MRKKISCKGGEGASPQRKKDMRLAGWRLRCTHCVGNLTRTSVTLSCRYWHQSSKSRVTLTSDLILLHVFPGLATIFRSSYPVCFPSWNVWNLRKWWKHLIEQEVCPKYLGFSIFNSAFKRWSVTQKLSWQLAWLHSTALEWKCRSESNIQQNVRPWRPSMPSAKCLKKMEWTIMA